MRKLSALLLALLLLAACPVLAEEDDDLSMGEILSGVADETVSSISRGFTEEDYVELEDEEEEEEILEKDGSILITLTAAGDFTIGGDSRKSASRNIFEAELKKHGGDVNYTLANVKDILAEDDLTLINFEGTLTDSTYVPNNKKNNEFLFSAPPSYVRVLPDNSVEAVSLENNHVLDHGEDVYAETQQHIADAGVVWSNSEHMGVYEVKGVRIAMLSYLCIDRYDKLWDKVAADIAEAKETNDLVVVSFHWGNEKDYAPTQNQIKMGRYAVDHGADLVLGHHSHRIQPIECYKGVYICYSLANFCFAGNSKPSDMSSFLFQTRWRQSPEGELTNEGFRIIPIRISSTSAVNDFCPTPLTKETAIDSILTTLRSNGKKLEYAVADYPLDWN